MSQLTNSYPPWSPRIWNGMRLGGFWRMLLEHGGRIHPLKWGMTFLGTGCAGFNSALRPLQQLFFDRRIAQTNLAAPPLFIIGHWRSGTTLLHELLTLDESVTCPTTLDTFIPHHLLVSRAVLKPLVSLLLPGRRPMDNMELAGDSPQEDDFALISLGAPTSYRGIAFPRDRLKETLVFDPAELAPADRERLRWSLDYFYRTLTCRTPKPLVLKSPPHTARLSELSEWFPGARFIHISREPYKLVPSTARMWRTLDETQGFQLARYSEAEMRQFVHRCQGQLYGAFLKDRPHVQGQLFELQFEQLVANPRKTMEALLEQLAWPQPGPLLEKIDRYFAARQQLKPSTSTPPAEICAEIDQHWHAYRAAFGY
ncbi:MAG: sulfotransferase family protein [Planctomycetota bacterium]